MYCINMCHVLCQHVCCMCQHVCHVVYVSACVSCCVCQRVCHVVCQSMCYTGRNFGEDLN